MIVATPGRGLIPQRSVMNSGIVLLVQEVRASPMVALNATFYTGSVDDPDRLPGVAYLTGEAIDRGTTRRTADDIAETLDDRGVSLRIEASRHTFTISCVCLTEHFDEILALVADIVRDPVFPPLEIEKRRSEAITSIREDEDDPSKVAADLLMEALYGAGHPYGVPLKGMVRTIEAIGREDLVGYHRRHMVPSALRLAVVGDIPADGVTAGAARVFSGWTSGPSSSHPVLPPPVRTSRAARTRPMPGKSQADICYGFTAIRRLDPRYYAYWIMNSVLGQFGLGGRLAENIRERQGMAYYAYSSLEATVGEGPLIVRAGVDPKNVDRTIAAIDAEVLALARSGPTADEFTDSRESLIGSVPRMLETNESIADFLQHAEQFGLGLDYDRQLPELLRAVTIDEVREAARLVLDPERAVVAVAGPST